jgi:cytochrome c biogenesis protein CcdA
MAPDQKNTIKEVLFYFSFLMVLVYIGLGLMFLFSDFMSEMVKDYRSIIGGVFIIYGVFRMYILMRMRKARNMQNQRINETKE